MSFIDIAHKRYSCRNYQSRKIDKTVLAEILEAARIAPSASNQQPWFFYVIQDDENLLQQIKSTYQRQWIDNVPAIIVCCADVSTAWVRKTDNKNHAEIDISIAIDHLTLQAADLGLGTCWVCNFDVQKTIEILQLPNNLIPVALLPIGYPESEVGAEHYQNRRKKLEEISKFL